MIRWADHLHGPGFIYTGYNTAAAAHAFFSVHRSALGANFRLVLDLSGTELTFRDAGFTSPAFFRVGHSFETAFGNSFRDLELVLSKQVSQYGAAAPMAITN